MFPLIFLVPIFSPFYLLWTVTHCLRFFFFIDHSLHRDRSNKMSSTTGRSRLLRSNNTVAHHSSQKFSPLVAIRVAHLKIKDLSSKVRSPNQQGQQQTSFNLDFLYKSVAHLGSYDGCGVAHFFSLRCTLTELASSPICNLLCKSKT